MATKIERRTINGEELRDQITSILAPRIIGGFMIIYVSELQSELFNRREVEATEQEIKEILDMLVSEGRMRVDFAGNYNIIPGAFLFGRSKQ